MKGHKTGGTSDWGLYHITVQQYHTLEVLFVSHTHGQGGLLGGPQAAHLEDAACMTQSGSDIPVSLLIQLVTETRLLNH